MDTKNVGIEDGRKSLGSLVDEARSGTGIVLTRHGRPVARLVPIEEPRRPTTAEWIRMFRTFSIMPTVVDTLGLDKRDPAGWDISVAQVSTEAAPFAKLVADIEAFFGDELEAALSGPESAAADAELHRIVGENLAAATVRLALSADAGSRIDWVTANSDTLQRLARLALRRAADLRFVEIVSPAAKAPVG